MTTTRTPAHVCYKVPSFDCPACQADEKARDEQDGPIAPTTEGLAPAYRYDPFA